MVSIKSGLKPAIFRAGSIDIKRFVFFAIFLYLCLKHLPGEPFVKGLCGCLNGNDGSTIDEYAIVFTRGRINDVYVDAGAVLLQKSAGMVPLELIVMSEAIAVAAAGYLVAKKL